MSFLGKLKSLHGGPPAPPKRIDNDHGYGWPEDEFDDDGDTYEAPPCERPAMKAPPRQVEENVYLERSSAPDPSRQAPPPRLAKILPPGNAPKLERQHDSEETYIDPNVKTPPQINREEKPGKKPAPRKPPPSRYGPASAPTPNSAPNPSLEEDVYLCPNEEEEEDSDELYLEPNAACPPPPSVAMKMLPPPKSVPREAPPPMGKPPVPRALSNAHLPGDVKTAQLSESIRTLFPVKQPTSAFGIKLHLPPSLKESKPSLPLPSQTDSAAGGVKHSALSGTEESQLQDKEWFAGNCDRKTAEAVLSRVKKDGAFLVRYSSAQNTWQPYTLVVLYRQKVYNIPIRYLDNMQGYALGKEGKKNEEFFSSLQEIISHHKNKPILLIDSKSQAKHTTYLTYPTHP
ncbi:hypothetical protein SKAU_G00011070 [Synaphobranchus kaupii]|uniref:SH2 domain-containing protein n=1 Tax=Synaphobranchus kaupii TaxID=118154 RepID=A0A9Q1GA15_SYNKA|nr:hypothetical protein SKAU_G00011070 [Synaphobranchus kaupii]